ncbi:MAG: DUF1848 domain-containing protein, partial [Elusimicrobiota bacterium]|nr:DUF1848 domain-containing protein [Elusimicrobiota bacterium]
AYRSFFEPEMLAFAAGLRHLNETWHFDIASCAEKIPLEQFKINHNKCIDDVLMRNLFSDDEELIAFLDKAPQQLKDKGQREFCGCIASKDIGGYAGCPFLCKYCYASDPKRAFDSPKRDVFREMF